MKYREGFVANSSSSSFILKIDICLENGKRISFTGNGGTAEVGRIDYFEGDIKSDVSPKQMGMAESVEEMIKILTAGVRDDNYWDDDYNGGIPVFAKSKRMCMYGRRGGKKIDAYDFVKEIREKVTSMDDIVSISVSGTERNYMTYAQTYVYNRKTGEYTGDVVGCEFEKDGSSGGELSIPDLDECNVKYDESEE